MKSRFSPHPWLIAACLLLAACTGSTTNSPGPPTAFGLWRFTPAGALDTTFPFGATAPQGFTFTNVVPGGFSFALAAAVQPADNKIVVAGSSGLAGQGTVALVRYLPNGTLDTSFVGPAGNPTPGIVQTPLLSPASASAVAVQPAVQPADQKIVVAALTFAPSTSTTGIAVLRYNIDGTLDTTFGTTGVVSNAIIGQGLATDTCALALQSDGKIVVAGASQTGNIVLFRYNTDGTADTFGTNGSTTTSLGTGTVAMSPGLALLSDNSIIVVTGNGLDQVVLHYSTAGVLDPTFGNPTTTNGIVTTDVGSGQNFANAVAVQSDNKIVVVGHANVSSTTSDISLVRYNANGTLDTTTFGGGTGIVVTDLGGFDNAFSVTLDTPAAATTNILVSGNTGFGGGQAVVLRYATNGALDTTFNPANGFAIPPLFGPSTVASGNVVLQTTLGIIVAGFD
jgi:uncharacterized delta-60 repeat protein